MAVVGRRRRAASVKWRTTRRIYQSSARGEKGVALVLRHDGERAPVPALILNRRGELLATLLDHADPFPSFHGQGGCRERPGDTLPRLQGVTRIALSVDRDE
jgi:hypothetical protein